MPNLTAYPNGVSSFGIPVLGGFAGIPFNGPYYFVNETTGLDGNSGLNPQNALKTLDQALLLESTATGGAGGRNAVVYFWGTQHRTKTLAWNLPSTHLIGIDSPMLRGKRARISVSGATGFNKLVENSAAGNYFANFGTFYGWTDAATALIAWSDTGGRATYDNVEFLGFGDGTAVTGSANLTGSRAFVFNNNTGETTWRNCVFGVDTTTRNVTNYTLEVAGNAPRLTFDRCNFEAYLGASGGGSSHLLIGTAGIDRYLDMIGCRFHASGNSGGTTMSQALHVAADAGGTVFLDQCTFGPGITAWQTAPTANVVMNMTAPGAGGGKAIQNA